MSLKILHVVPTYLPARRYGGPIYSVHGLCKSLVELGVDVSVYTTSVDGPKDSPVPIDQEVEMDGVKIRYFKSPFRRLYYSPQLKRRLESKIAEFDLVHIHSMFLWPTLIACRIADRSRKPYILSPRGMLVRELIETKSSWLKKLWLTLFDKTNLERAAVLHLTSQVEVDEIQNLMPNINRYVQIPNGTDVPADNCWQGGRNKILFLGRIHYKKGLMLLIEALAGGMNGELLIAGNDEENHAGEVLTHAQQLGVADRIVLLGPVSGQQKSDLFQEASVFVMPSVNENFGIAALEAMSHGCPTVVSEGCGIASEVEDKACLVVVPLKSDELAAAVNNIIDSVELSRELSQKGFTEAARFGWPNIATRMKAAYQMVLSGQT